MNVVVEEQPAPATVKDPYDHWVYWDEPDVTLCGADARQMPWSTDESVPLCPLCVVAEEGQ